MTILSSFRNTIYFGSEFVSCLFFLWFPLVYVCPIEKVSKKNCIRDVEEDGDSDLE